MRTLHLLNLNSPTVCGPWGGARRHYGHWPRLYSNRERRKPWGCTQARHLGHARLIGRHRFPGAQCVRLRVGGDGPLVAPGDMKEVAIATLLPIAAAAVGVAIEGARPALVWVVHAALREDFTIGAQGREAMRRHFLHAFGVVFVILADLLVPTE